MADGALVGIDLIKDEPPRINLMGNPTATPRGALRLVYRADDRVLGADAIAVTADSASIPESHKRDAEAFVHQFGIAHEYIQTYEFDNPDYVQNNPDRCFHCKDELFTQVSALCEARGIQQCTSA